MQRDLQEKLRTQFGVNFLNKIGLLARSPWLMRRVLNSSACFSTALLTNLSDPSRRLRKRLPVDADSFFWLGGARCYDLQVRTPPLRPKTHWGMGIFEYAGRMTVTFRYDATTISAADAERVLGNYIAGWRHWLGMTDTAAAGFDHAARTRCASPPGGHTPTANRNSSFGEKRRSVAPVRYEDGPGDEASLDQRR